MDFAGAGPESSRVPPTAANCCAVIPCRNEAESVGAVVRAVQPHLPTVLVVDDGSSDRTRAEAEAAGASVWRQENSQGKGAALQAGWRRAHELACEWVLMLDGDGQHLAEDIPLLLAAATGFVRLVVGNRMENPVAMPWLRRAANRWLSARVSALAGVPVPDSQCGFRLAHLPTLRTLGLRFQHFEIESEMCVAFARAGHRIVSVPVQSRYGGRGSHISPGRDYWRWWRWYRETRRSLRQ